MILFQAAQRGLKATVQLLEGLLDGVDASNGPVYVVDLMPSKLLRSILGFGEIPNASKCDEISFVSLVCLRYGEWSRAVWDLQHKRLASNSSSRFDWRYVGYFQEMDGVDAGEWAQRTAGAIQADPRLLIY